MGRVSRAGGDLVLDVVEDGLTDEEIAARTADWLRQLATEPIVSTSETAAEALDRLNADGDP